MSTLQSRRLGGYCNNVSPDEPFGRGFQSVAIKLWAEPESRRLGRYEQHIYNGDADDTCLQHSDTKNHFETPD